MIQPPGLDAAFNEGCELFAQRQILRADRAGQAQEQHEYAVAAMSFLHCVDVRPDPMVISADGSRKREFSACSLRAPVVAWLVLREDRSSRHKKSMSYSQRLREDLCLRAATTSGNASILFQGER